MRPDAVMQRMEKLGNLSEAGKRINGLYRLMETPVLWYDAYARIYSNNGAITKGGGATTLDGFSQGRVDTLIGKLRDGTYRPHPVRRLYIPKRNGKKRPLGVPSGDDKLVQEVVRHILERIYEPVFQGSSYGFRPARSCHTALEAIKETWDGVKWLVNVDIQGFFDNMDHEVMLALLKKKIDDTRFINLIRVMLKAGYLEDWRYHRTYSGTPQGGICSPILSNIYLHELDCFMDTMTHQFNQGEKRQPDKRYRHLTNQLKTRRRTEHEMDEANPQRPLLHAEVKSLEAARNKRPAGDPFDTNFRRLSYCRYADDFLIGVIGSKAEAEDIMAHVKEFISNELRLPIAEEKSLIAHGQKGVTFLGYEIRIYTGRKIIRVKRRGVPYLFPVKSVSEKMQLFIPHGRLQEFCTAKGYGHWPTCSGMHRPVFNNLSEPEIVQAYNAELRGLANYYALAYSAKTYLHRLHRVWQVSLFKTLAAKRKRSVSQVARSLKTEAGYALVTPLENGAERRLELYNPKHLRRPSVDPDPVANIGWAWSRSELIRRLTASRCDYCNDANVPCEVHHVRKLADVKKGKEEWQKLMIAKRRKTLVLCHPCHRHLHAGTLPPRQVTRL